MFGLSIWWEFCAFGDLFGNFFLESLKRNVGGNLSLRFILVFNLGKRKGPICGFLSKNGGREEEEEDAFEQALFVFVYTIRKRES